jgi:hypothetical protein
MRWFDTVFKNEKRVFERFFRKGYATAVAMAIATDKKM